MSWLTILWSMCGAASGMLAAIHLLLWIHDRRRGFFLWSALACIGAAWVAGGELALMFSRTTADANTILVFQNLAIACLIISLTWFVYDWFGTGRRWLALTITALWLSGLVAQLLLPGNLTFSEVTSLAPLETAWGEAYVLPTGTANRFRFLTDLASLLFLIFVVNASLRLGRKGGGRRAWSVGGVIVFFILFAGVHTPLVDAGFVKTPYLIGFFFLAIVFGMTYELVREVSRASRIAEDLRRVRSELEHFGRVNLLGEISAAMAHELNQPLAAILANAQAGSRFLQSEDPDLDEIAAILNDIAKDDKRAREVILRLRSLLEKGEAVLTTACLNKAIEEAIEMMSCELRSSGVKLELDLDDSIPEIPIDRPGIQQVIINLLLNAERAAAANRDRARRVTLESRRGRESVTVEVSDSGKGIDAGAMAKIFDPFYTSEAGGFGMGLSICQAIVEDHGGGIQAANRKGGGAVFSFTLPLAVSGKGTSLEHGSDD